MQATKYYEINATCMLRNQFNENVMKWMQRACHEMNAAEMGRIECNADTTKWVQRNCHEMSATTKSIWVQRTCREYIATNMSRNECNETLTEWMQRKCDGMARTKMLRMNAAKVLRKASNENVTKCVQWQRNERRQRTCFDMGPTSSLGNACFENGRKSQKRSCHARSEHDTKRVQWKC